MSKQPPITDSPWLWFALFSAVGLIANDDSLTTVIVEPAEVNPAIGVPSGNDIGPRAIERGLPIAVAINGYF